MGGALIGGTWPRSARSSVREGRCVGSADWRGRRDVASWARGVRGGQAWLVRWVAGRVGHAGGAGVGQARSRIRPADRRSWLCAVRIELTMPTHLAAGLGKSVRREDCGGENEGKGGGGGGGGGGRRGGGESG